jgi:3-hydroxy-9,10-secoandrosta-1,3,5(10)-triene-9,17-dione monooxygenase
MEIASHWPEQAQRELFGPTGDFRAAHRAPPAGKVERVPGGYSISGTWSYSSGVPISTHFIGGAVYAAPGETPLGISFIVPVDKIEILPGSWGGDVSLGMQGSGSHSVRLDRVFVPEHHVTPSMLIGTLPDPQNGTAGTRLHDNPFYLGQLGGPFHLTFGGILTGTARAALDEYEELMRTRKVMFNPQEMRLNDPESQRSFGKALALTDSAEALTMAAAQMYMDYCARWGRDRTPISTEDTLRLWCMAQEACFMACDAVDLLFRTASATAANRGQRMQRYFRDIQMYLIHPSSQPWTSTARAQAHLKLPIAMFGVAPQTVRIPSRPE